MAKVKPILPQSYIDQAGNKVVYYRPKPNNDKKHVYINDEDNREIYYNIQRMLAQCCEKQFLDPKYFNYLTKVDPVFSISSYGKSIKGAPKQNSPLSYASGLLSNYLRNGSQDFTVKQLPKIEILCQVIHVLYTQQGLEIGFNYNTKIPNETPLPIKFVEA